jgi:hypothetical protein
MKNIIRFILVYLVLTITSYAQETDLNFHGMAILSQKNGPDIYGAIKVSRYIPKVRNCTEYWSMQFTPTFKDLDFIREIIIPKNSNDQSSDSYSWMWVTGPTHQWGDGGWVYILSDSHATVSLLIIPAEQSVRKLFNITNPNYNGNKIFMGGFLVRHTEEDYIQIDILGTCSVR